MPFLNFLRTLTDHKWTWITWTVLMFIVCNLPASKLPKASFIGLDKIVHFILFAGWTSLLLRSFRPTVAFAILTGLAFGVLIELCQQLLPFNRTFDWWDVVADAAGIVAGLVIKSALLDRYLQRLY